MPQKERATLLDEIGRLRDSTAILFVTGTRPYMATQIAGDSVENFVHHLDAIGVTKKLSVVLHTNGGDITAAWSLVNLLHMFCDELEVIVPWRAMSAGTLLCLGAKRIVMTKQAVLGPIDPSVNNPLGPAVGSQRLPVSVEDLNGFLDFMRKSTADNADMTFALSKLAQDVHPLVLGQAHRIRDQIRMLGSRLLEANGYKQEAIARITDFLCSEARSHDYTINRREAATRLQLPVEKSSEELYQVIKALWKDIRSQMELDKPFNHYLVAAGVPLDYHCIRAVVESRVGGAHSFTSVGTLAKVPVPGQPGAVALTDDRTQEGWQYADPVA